jgi:tetratricopeptide (TPR) repeat protein
MDVALSKYRAAAVSAPNSAHLWNNIGMCFFGQQKFTPAIACLKHAHYLDPFEWIISYNLGLVHLNTQQYASAFHYLSASITIKTDFAHSFMYLGIALSRLEDFPNACVAYKKAIEMETDYLFHLNFSITLAKHGRLAEANEHYRHCMRLWEDSDEETKQIDSDVAAQIALLAPIMDSIANDPVPPPLPDNPAPAVLKVVVLGDPGVGKDSVLQSGGAMMHHDPNLSNAEGQATERPIDIGGLVGKLILYQGRAGEQHLSTADGIIVVFDVTQENSFRNVQNWSRLVADRNQTANTLLLANKVDLRSDPSITTELGRQQASAVGFDYNEVSATQGNSVAEALENFASAIYQDRNRTQPPPAPLAVEGARQVGPSSPDRRHHIAEFVERKQ